MARRGSTKPASVPAMPKRPRDGHKGTFGHVLVLAGSSRYPGAAVLATRAALRSGCGLVTLGCPESVRPLIATQLVCEMSVPLADAAPGVFSRDAVSEAVDLAERCDAAALGPGLSQEAAAHAFARDFALIAPVPLVIDADGLNALAKSPADVARAEDVRILTPHPAEAARLLGRAMGEVVSDRRRAAVELARLTRSVVALKGAGTVVTDGTRVYVNRTGNPGMATAGSGDVLTGVIVSLLAQGLSAFDAACLGVHLHGSAGDLAAARLGEHGMIATDLLDDLPRACLQHERRMRK